MSQSNNKKTPLKRLMRQTSHRMRRLTSGRRKTISQKKSDPGLKVEA